jgi:hypothetical protein
VAHDVEALIINEAGNDVDFRVEASGVADAISVNGADGVVTLGELGTGVVYATAGVLSEKTIGIADDNIVEIDDADAADNDFAKFTANGLEGRSYAETLADLSGQATGAFSWNSQNLSAIGTIGCGTITSTGNLVIADAGNIGSASDTDAIAISAGGVVTLTVQNITDNVVLTVDDADAADNDFAKFTANGLEGRSYSEVLADLSAGAGAAFSWNSQNIFALNSIYLIEQAAADAEIANSGQIWVKTGAPCQLWFTDDAGTDSRLDNQSGAVGNPLNIGTDDTTLGVINVYGGGAGDDGGQVNIYVGSDDDSAFEYFKIEAKADDLIIGTDGVEEVIKLVGVNAAGDITEVVFNDGSYDIDFRIESNNTDPIFKIDAGADTITFGKGIFVTELAAAQGDTAGLGQLWIKSDAPNVPFFTNDDGVDFNLLAGSDGLSMEPYMWSAQSVGQGTWVAAISPSLYKTGYYYNSSTNNGDNITYTFICSAGTYTIETLFYHATIEGIIDIYIDGVEVDSVDCYAGSAANLVNTTSGQVLTAGSHTLKYQVDGKNASSSDYACVFEDIIIYRTA